MNSDSWKILLKFWVTIFLTEKITAWIKKKWMFTDDSDEFNFILKMSITNITSRICHALRRENHKKFTWDCIFIHVYFMNEHFPALLLLYIMYVPKRGKSLSVSKESGMTDFKKCENKLTFWPSRRIIDKW